MSLKILKPTNAGQRGTILVEKSHLWKGKFIKISNYKIQFNWR